MAARTFPNTHVIPAKAGIWMRHPRTILRMRPVTLQGLGYSHGYVVERRTGDSRLRGNDVMCRGNDVMGAGISPMAAPFILRPTTSICAL